MSLHFSPFCRKISCTFLKNVTPYNAQDTLLMLLLYTKSSQHKSIDILCIRSVYCIDKDRISSDTETYIFYMQLLSQSQSQGEM